MSVPPSAPGLVYSEKKPRAIHTNFVITGGHTKELLDTPSCSRSSRDLKLAFRTTEDQD